MLLRIMGQRLRGHTHHHYAAALDAAVAAHKIDVEGKTFTGVSPISVAANRGAKNKIFSVPVLSDELL